MIALLVRRTIRATPERLFDAWTDPTQLVRWWGPKGVVCTHAEIDLRVGGRYRLANRFPDGAVVWINGEFEHVERPSRLVYTWRVEPESALERVTVRFDSVGDGTEIVVLHERIPDSARRDRHEVGWRDCLERLDHLAAGG